MSSQTLNCCPSVSLPQKASHWRGPSVSVRSAHEMIGFHYGVRRPASFSWTYRADVTGGMTGGVSGCRDVWPASLSGSKRPICSADSEHGELTCKKNGDQAFHSTSWGTGGVSNSVWYRNPAGRFHVTIRLRCGMY